MDADNQATFQNQFQAGKEALEQGQYRLSIQYLEAASQLIALSSRLGGELQICLVTAYQAAERSQDARSLCQQLTKHPHPEIRKQGKRILYILEAPRLQRPKEWMTEIPNLENFAESDAQYRRGSGSRSAQIEKSSPTEPIDLSQLKTQDNHFIWIALLVVLLGLGGFLWLQ